MYKDTNAQWTHSNMTVPHPIHPMPTIHRLGQQSVCFGPSRVSPRTGWELDVPSDRVQATLCVLVRLGYILPDTTKGLSEQPKPEDHVVIFTKPGDVRLDICMEPSLYCNNIRFVDLSDLLFWIEGFEDNRVKVNRKPNPIPSIPVLALGKLRRYLMK